MVSISKYENIGLEFALISIKDRSKTGIFKAKTVFLLIVKYDAKK